MRGLPLLLGLVVACGGEDEPAAECEELGELCHDAGEAAGEGSLAYECHEYGHDATKTAEECIEKRAECEAACATSDTDTDA
jgi:hypothetical protein